MIGQFVLVVSSVQTIITKFNFLWLKQCAVSWSSQFYEDCNVVDCTRFGSKLIDPSQGIHPKYMKSVINMFDIQ